MLKIMYQKQSRVLSKNLEVISARYSQWHLDFIDVHLVLLKHHYYLNKKNKLQLLKAIIFNPLLTQWNTWFLKQFLFFGVLEKLLVYYIALYFSG